MDRGGAEVFREARLPNCYLHLAWARRSYLDKRSPVSVRVGVGRWRWWPADVPPQDKTPPPLIDTPLSTCACTHARTHAAGVVGLRAGAGGPAGEPREPVRDERLLSLSRQGLHRPGPVPGRCLDGVTAWACAFLFGCFFFVDVGMHACIHLCMHAWDACLSICLPAGAHAHYPLSSQNPNTRNWACTSPCRASAGGPWRTRTCCGRRASSGPSWRSTGRAACPSARRRGMYMG